MIIDIFIALGIAGTRNASRRVSHAALHYLQIVRCD
jgi:hypothetical protein